MGRGGTNAIFSSALAAPREPVFFSRRGDPTSSTLIFVEKHALAQQHPQQQQEGHAAGAKPA